MNEPAIALNCGHWTTRNPDGTVPCLCRYCLLKGAADVTREIKDGTFQIEPEMLRAMIELPKKLLRNAPKALEEYRKKKAKEQKGRTSPGESE